jgi:biopolymer transport protein ExbB/TolQ
MAAEQPKIIKSSDDSGPMVLRIEGIIASAEKIRERIRSELPTHGGLTGAVDYIVAAANSAQLVTRQIKHPLSFHRLPAIFLAFALLLLGGWVYWNFFHVSTLSVATANRDSGDLFKKSAETWRLRLNPTLVPGSKEAVEFVSSGRTDLAFVQGGMPIPDELPRLRSPSDEVVLWLTRQGVQKLDEVRKVITSVEGEGSHTVAKLFMKEWGVEDQVEFLHQWGSIADGALTTIPEDVQGVFVVKDASDPATLRTLNTLYGQNFRLQSPYLGAIAEGHDFLEEVTLPPGYFDSEPLQPEQELLTYRIPTFLVARRNLTPRLLAVAAQVFDSEPLDIADQEYLPTASTAGEMFQGVEAFLGIIVNIVLAFLALMGLEMMTYRKRFHELNSLVSLLSMLQSNKDILGVTDTRVRNENLKYLSTVSDLLGLISAVSGYYTQENSSLLFNNLSEVVHQRCDNLKLNIQLKILHAGIQLDKLPPISQSPLV